MTLNPVTRTGVDPTPTPSGPNGGAGGADDAERLDLVAARDAARRRRVVVVLPRPGQKAVAVDQIHQREHIAAHVGDGHGRGVIRSPAHPGPGAGAEADLPLDVGVVQALRETGVAGAALPSAAAPCDGGAICRISARLPRNLGARGWVQHLDGNRIVGRGRGAGGRS